jgi:hypothetical protein
VRKLERRKPTIVIDGQLINEKSEREGKKENPILACCCEVHKILKLNLTETSEQFA